MSCFRQNYTFKLIKVGSVFATIIFYFSESLQQVLQQNHRVVDNPVYLCDLGASLSAAESKELQEILEEMNVNMFI